MSSKKIFIVSLLMTIVVGFFVVANLAQAADDYGLSATAGAAGLTKTMSGDFPTIVGNLLGTALSFIGVLFFALMVFGGFMWMTARGNEEQTKKALNTITAAVIGLVIVLSSYTITSFVFKSAGVQSGGTASSGQTQSTVGTDTWCGRTDVELLSTFEIPSGWTSYKCMDVIVSVDEEAKYCKDGKLYADKDVNKCPGSQKCCDSTTVPEGYGKFCLVKAAAVGSDGTCEKIGFDFDKDKVCIGKYDTETACKTAIANGAGQSLAEGSDCKETASCEDGLVCRKKTFDSTKTTCEQKLGSDAGPCFNPDNDCKEEGSVCVPKAVGTVEEVCSKPRGAGYVCKEVGDCEKGYKCSKEFYCELNTTCTSNNDCQSGQYCTNGNRNDTNLYPFACKTGAIGEWCDDDSDCDSTKAWCKPSGLAGQPDKCVAKLIHGEKCDRNEQCKVQCLNGSCYGT